MAPKSPPPKPVGARPDIKWLSIDDLLLDSANPRIADWVGSKSTQADIQGMLMTRMEGAELIPSFRANGYIPCEPIIVRPQSQGKYVVLEGNRRVAALKEMQRSTDPAVKKDFLEKQLGKVPCLIFPGNERDELSYLGLRHISKTKDWEASAKAGFVERLLKSGFNLSAAAEHTNTSVNALRLMLLVRRLFEKAATLDLKLPMGSAEGDVRFWHLGDAVRRTKMKNYLRVQENENPLEAPSVDETRFTNALTWLYGSSDLRRTPLISSIRDIPRLDTAVGHPEGARVLEEGGSIDEALEEIEATGSVIASHLDQAKRSIGRALRKSTDPLSPEGKDQVKAKIVEVRKALDALEGALKGHE